MPWKESGVMEERLRFIQEWHSESWSMAELCRDFGVTRKTGYKWLERYEAGGMEGLQDESRAPHTHPNAVAEETEERLIAIPRATSVLGSPETPEDSGAGRGGPGGSGGEHDREHPQESWINGGAETAAPRATEPGTAGAREQGEPGVVCGFQGMVSKRGW